MKSIFLARFTHGKKTANQLFLKIVLKYFFCIVNNQFKTVHLKIYYFECNYDS